MARYIFIHPQNQYSFRSNSSYYAQWRFLPDKERVKVIAAQLTYLNFHEWLFKNLRHSANPKPGSDLSTLVFDVAEGFFRTDVLLYASICEAALYVVAKEFFDSKKQKPADLLAAFLTSEEKIIRLGNQTFIAEGISPPVTGRIGLCSTKVTRKKDSTISFDSLIKAASAIDAINADLAAEIDDLRKARNTIHLGAQLARRQATPRRFQETDRQTAKQVVEQMRLQLDSYYSSRVRPKA